MHSTIIVFASARRHGNTGKLADLLASKLDAGVIDLGTKTVSGFDYAHRNRGDDFEPLMEEILACDNIVFASPVYWYAMAPAMKTFIDRITDYLDLPDLLDKGRQLRGKTAYVVCTSIHAEVDACFLGAFRKIFAYLGMGFGGCLHANCRDGFPAGSLEDDISTFIRLVRTNPALPIQKRSTP